VGTCNRFSKNTTEIRQVLKLRNASTVLREPPVTKRQLNKVNNEDFITDPGFSKYACQTIRTSFGGRPPSRNEEILEFGACLYHPSKLNGFRIMETLPS
jgi:hypothetical protein